VAWPLGGVARKKKIIQFMITWDPEIDGTAKIALRKDATATPLTLSKNQKRPWRSMASARKLVPTAVLSPAFTPFSDAGSCLVMFLPCQLL
jgi:hypothetical protein